MNIQGLGWDYGINRDVSECRYVDCPYKATHMCHYYT